MVTKKRSLLKAVGSPMKVDKPTVLRTNEPYPPGPGYEKADPFMIEHDNGSIEYKWKLIETTPEKVIPGTTTPGRLDPEGDTCAQTWAKNKEAIIAQGYKTWEEFKPYCDQYLEDKVEETTVSTPEEVIPGSETVTEQSQIFMPEEEDQGPCPREKVMQLAAECEERGGRYYYSPTIEPDHKDTCGECREKTTTTNGGGKGRNGGGRTKVGDFFSNIGGKIHNCTIGPAGELLCSVFERGKKSGGKLRKKSRNISTAGRGRGFWRKGSRFRRKIKKWAQGANPHGY